MTVKSGSRARRPIFVVSAVSLLGALAFACTETRHILGEDCIKDQDCQSDICSNLKCAAAPPLLDRDASTHPAADSSTDAVAEAGGDASTADAPAEAAPDAAAD